MITHLLKISIIGFLLLPLFSQTLAIENHINVTLSKDEESHLIQSQLTENVILREREESHLSADLLNEDNTDSSNIFDSIALPCPEDNCSINFVITGLDSYSDSDLEKILLYQDLVQKTLKQIPYSLWSPLQKLTFSFDSNINRGSASFRQIQLRIIDVTEDEFVSVFVHELGHLVDLGALTGNLESGESAFPDGLRASYNDDPSLDFYTLGWDNPSTISANLRTSGRIFTTFITGYSKTDCFEHFAETFNAYVLHPDFLKARNLSEYNYFRDQVFAGLEYQNFSAISKYDQAYYDSTLLPYDMESFLEEGNQ